MHINEHQSCLKGSNCCPYPDYPHNMKIGKSNYAYSTRTAKARLMRFPVPHCTGTGSRHRGGPAGVRRAPREVANCHRPCLGSLLRSAARWPWALRQLLDNAACALLCPRHPQGHPRCLCRYAHARGNGAQLPALPRWCLFPRHAARAASLPCILWIAMHIIRGRRCHAKR